MAHPDYSSFSVSSDVQEEYRKLMLQKRIVKFADDNSYDAELLTQAADRDGWLRLHDPKNLCIVGCTKLHPLTVVPPDILVRLRQEADVIVDFLCNQSREITEEGTDLVKLRVRSYAWC